MPSDSSEQAPPLPSQKILKIPQILIQTTTQAPPRTKRLKLYIHFPPTLIGGFQSPIEREFLELLLRQPATQPGHPAPPSPSVIICPARSLTTMRIPRPWRDPLAAGRFLLLSTFPDSLRHSTTATAVRRNACVAALAHRILILHAAQGSKTEALCQQALAAAKPVYTLPSPHNAHLIALAAHPIPPDDPSALLAG